MLGARSGDKGGDANVGLWVPEWVEPSRRERTYSWLAGWLTPDRVRELLPDAAGLEVDVHAFPHLAAVNVVLHGFLGRGVAANTLLDPQAKGLGERLRARLVDVPADLLDDEHGRRMTTMTPTTARGRRTRDALVSAAREVFERRGFSDTRMSDLAEAAGVSHGTVYTYFASKEAVLSEVCNAIVGEVFAAVRVPDERRADPVTWIEEGNRRYLLAYSRNARMLEVVEQAATTDPHFREPRRRAARGLRRQVPRHPEPIPGRGPRRHDPRPRPGRPRTGGHGRELRSAVARPRRDVRHRAGGRNPDPAVDPGRRAAAAST